VVALSRIAVFAALGGAVAALYARRASAPVATLEPADPAPVNPPDTTAAFFQPRGLRLNNPGNIRKSPNNWQGMAAVQSDPEYVTFTAAKWGLRALARLLTNYQKQGFRSIRQIINRYAPPKENNTGAYVAHVSQWMKKKPDDLLAFPGDLQNLIAAIVRHENGINPFTSAQLAEAIRLAQ